MQPTEFYLRMQTCPQTKTFVIRNPSAENVMIKIAVDSKCLVQFDKDFVVVESQKLKEIRMTVNEDMLHHFKKNVSNVLFYMLPMKKGSASSAWIQQNSFCNDELVFKLQMKVSLQEFSSPKIILDLPIFLEENSDKQKVFVESKYLYPEDEGRVIREDYIIKS
ncbi:unnamed protein product [Auanema sp. JU1783]|nr:unnamed protein product [Auanema sp. JU1783]